MAPNEPPRGLPGLSLEEADRIAESLKPSWETDEPSDDDPATARIGTVAASAPQTAPGPGNGAETAARPPAPAGRTQIGIDAAPLPDAPMPLRGSVVGNQGRQPPQPAPAAGPPIRPGKTRVGIGMSEAEAADARAALAAIPMPQHAAVAAPRAPVAIAPPAPMAPAPPTPLAVAPQGASAEVDRVGARPVSFQAIAPQPPQPTVAAAPAREALGGRISSGGSAASSGRISGAENRFSDVADSIEIPVNRSSGTLIKVVAAAAVLIGGLVAVKIFSGSQATEPAPTAAPTEAPAPPPPTAAAPPPAPTPEPTAAPTPAAPTAAAPQTAAPPPTPVAPSPPPAREPQAAAPSKPAPTARPQPGPATGGAPKTGGKKSGGGIIRETPF